MLRNEEIAVRNLNNLEINFNAKTYFEMINLDEAMIKNEMITEPPITEIQHLRIEKNYSNLKVFSLENYPNNTQAVERMISLVTKASTKVYG